MPQEICLFRVLRGHLKVQGRYTTDYERVRNYSLLGIDLHVLHYFCVYLTLAYFLHGFSLTTGQFIKEQRATPWILQFMSFYYARSDQPNGHIL